MAPFTADHSNTQNACTSSRLDDVDGSGPDVQSNTSSAEEGYRRAVKAAGVVELPDTSPAPSGDLMPDGSDQDAAGSDAPESLC